MTTTIVSDPLALPEPERLRRFGVELDAIKTRVEADMGASDVRYVRRLDRFSHGCELVGRLLIHFSFEPVGFGAGVLALWVHKQLQATEIGHAALHGAYDKLAGAEGYRSASYRWQIPIDEASWHTMHNVRHHGNTNVAGRDADIHFGPVRLTEQTPWAQIHRWQLPFTVLLLFPNFAFGINLHASGLSDLWVDNGQPTGLDFLPDRSKASRRLAVRNALRKWIPYYGKEYVLFPLLAGPMFWKVLLGNWLAETMRDIYSAATIFCGHVGEQVKSYPTGTKAGSRGQWYAMQVEATHDFEVGWPWNVFCGGLDRQIEHHLFPKLPAQRLRQIAPEVRAVCDRYGVEYKTDRWGRVLRRALGWIGELSRNRSPLAASREVLREMT
jgi:NADPH-dependent stearoyl-CoA 9-desaturase